MLSQKKIRGFIVDPHCNCVWTDIEIIPAVWECFVTDKLINRNPCFSLVWKEKLGVIDKRKKFDCFPLLYFNEYKEMEKDALEDWGGFCDEFEKLKSEETFRFAQAFPYLVRSMQEKERNRFYVLFDGFEWKITEIYVEASFGQIQTVLRNDWIEGEETIELIPVGEVDGDCKIEVSPWPELENFLEKKFPGRVRSLSGLPESWNTVPADPAAAAESAPASVSSLVGPGSAPAVAAAGSVQAAADTSPADCAAAESAPVDLWADIFGLAPVSQAEKVEVAPAAVPSLVRPGSAPAAADTVPADPGAVPAEFVPAVIQGTFAKIQDSVRDSKRENSLTEQKKTNLTLNESLDVQTEIRDLLKDGFEMMKPKELTDFEKRVMMFKEIEKRQGTQKARAEIWKTFGGSWKDVWAVEFPNDSLDNYHCKDRRREAERTKNSIKKFYPEYTPNAETDE